MDYVKQDEIEDLISKHIGNGEIAVGDLLPTSIPQLIIDLMNLYVPRVDKAIRKEYAQNGISEKFKELFSKRGLTWREYKLIFDKEIKEEEFVRYPAFTFLRIETEHGHFQKTQTSSTEHQDEYIVGRSDYTSVYEKEVWDYVRLLQDKELDIIRFFLQGFTSKIAPRDLFISHTYCVAKTRSGKTELMKVLLFNLLRVKSKNTSVLLLDPHADFAREAKRLSNQDKENLVYIDLSLKEGYTPVFNPFQVKSKNLDFLATATDHLLDTFQELLGDQGVTGNMKRLLRHAVMVCLYNDHYSMLDLMEIIRGTDTYLEVARSFPDKTTSNFFTKDYQNVDKRTITAVIERIDSIIAHPVVRKFLIGESSFDLEKLLNSGKVVIVNLDTNTLGSLGSEAIGRIFLAELKNIAQKRASVEKKRRPRTVAFIDECQNFVNPSTKKALSELTKYGIHLVLAHQYVSQLDDEMVDAMLSNTEIKIIGRTSASTLNKVAPEMHIKSKDLSEDLKRFHFYVKVSDYPAQMIKTKPYLVDSDKSPYYISEQEEKHLNNYMVQKYYTKIGEKQSKPVEQDLSINPDLEF